MTRASGTARCESCLFAGLRAEFLALVVGIKVKE